MHPECLIGKQMLRNGSPAQGFIEGKMEFSLSTCMGTKDPVPVRKSKNNKNEQLYPGVSSSALYKNTRNCFLM